MNETESLGRAEGGLESPVNIRNILGENIMVNINKRKRIKIILKTPGHGERFEDLGLRLTTEG